MSCPGRTVLSFTVAAKTSARCTVRTLALAASQAAADVHQAAGVGGDDAIDAGLLDEGGLVVHHRAADVRIANRERTAEAAAFVEAFERRQLQVGDVAQASRSGSSMTPRPRRWQAM